MSQPSPHLRAARATAAFWRGRVAHHGRGGWLLMVLLAVIALGALVFLIAGESPWDRGIPEKLAEKKELSIEDTIVAGLWLGAAINLGIALLLLALARWWARPVSEKPAVPALKSAPWFWAMISLAIIAAAFLRAPRLHHSFFNDEEQAFRKFTWGEYKTPKTGGDTLAFDSAGWDRALFYSVNGNNHVLHTVAAKLSHSMWKAIARPEAEAFREWVIRFEPFVSGLLLLPAIALWLRRAGFPSAGIVAAWVLAMHPWVLRYAVEARGYSAMLLLIVLALICATEAVRDGRWRWWIGYGLCQCAYLLCFAGAIYLAVAMNTLLAASLALRRDGSALGRWFVACTLGAMIFLQMMTATVLRIWRWIQAPHVEPFPMDLAWARDFWAHLTMGVPWSAPEPERHVGTSIDQIAGGSPHWDFAFTWILPVVILLGVIAACRRCREAKFLLATLALAVALIFLHNQISHLAFYGWYALYVVLGLAVALGFAAEWIGEKPRGMRAVAFAGVAIFFLVIVRDSGLAQRAHSRHPMREAVLAARGEAPAIDARHAALITAAAGSGANQIRTYDPRVIWIKTLADLEALVQSAHAAGKPLAIYACGPVRLRQDRPDLAVALADPARFEAGPYLPGQEEFWSFQIYRLKTEAAPARD